MNFNKFLRISIIFLVISAWIFSGFPRIWPRSINPDGFNYGLNKIRIPPEMKVAYATETTATTTTEEIIESTDELAKEPVSKEKVAEIPPDFSLDAITIKEIKGVILNAVVVRIERNQQNELWLFDVESGRQENIGLETSIAPDFPIGLKGGFVFWLSQDRHTLFAFNPESKIRLQKPVPAFDPANGERARIKFLEIPWEVIVGAEDFYFFSRRTGEVFSDGDSSVAELFRQKYNLDNHLTNEELSDLGLSVKE